MAQHDYDLANAAGATFRADLNAALAAIVSSNSGTTAPSPTFAYQLWADTTTGLLKRRDAANAAWIILGLLSGAGGGGIQNTPAGNIAATDVQAAINELDTEKGGLGTRNTWTKAQDVAQVSLTDAANIATDASLSNAFTVTLGGNRTLDNPTNLVSGQTIVWHINQDATGSRTLAYGTLFKFPSGVVPTLSTAASAKDTLTGIYDGTILRCSMQNGFA